MHPHERWLELAALDALGQLRAAERDELLEHLESCPECVSERQAMMDVTQNWLPTASTARPPRFVRNGDHDRTAFINRAQSEGLRFSAEAVRLSRNSRFRLGSLNTALTGAAAAAVACAMIAGGVFLSHTARTSQSHPVATAASTSKPKPESDGLEAQLAALQTQYAAEEAKVAVLQKENDETSRRAAQLDQLLQISKTQATQAREQLARAVANSTDEASRLAADLKQLDSLRADLEEVKSERASDQATLVAQQYKLADLSQQLRLQNASVDRDRELMAASRDIRDVMSARNLHIVDVHDIDSHGKQRKAFGRMFYTEGKSLIFYAYDLDTKGVKNASFQVWGQKADDQRAAVSLGVLYSDDQKQSRWVMKFDDPKVLAEIDSVFVTVESPGGSKKPMGKKMMYAYLLNDPNHP